MRIGTVEIKGRAALAPMAGVADRPFGKYAWITARDMW